MGLKSGRVLLFLLMLILLPFIRGCADDFSLGFPLLTVDKSFNLEMFFLNLLFIGALYFLFIKCRDYWNKLYFKKEIRWGVYSAICYHVIFIIGFFWVIILGEKGILSFIFSWMSYPIFMFEMTFFELGLVPLINITIPKFYPEEGDIYFRVIYITTLVVYFLAGYFAGKIYLKIKPSTNFPKGTTIEPEILTSMKHWFVSKWKKSVYWQRGAILGVIGGICSIPLLTYDFFYLNFLEYWHLIIYNILGRVLELIFQNRWDSHIMDTPFLALVMAIISSIIVTIPLILIGMALGFLYGKLRKK